jgi:hypothetical protein
MAGIFIPSKAWPKENLLKREEEDFSASGMTGLISLQLLITVKVQY